MITLLMAFFIMMYSMSVMNISKFREAAISIRSGFGGVIAGQGKSVLTPSGQVSFKPSPISGDTTGVAWQAIAKLRDTVKNDPIFKRAIRIFTDKRGIVLSMRSDKVLFDPGSADIKPEAYPVLARVADVIRVAPNEVRVEGHTCNLPISSSKFPSNWELSTARATRVIRYLIEQQKIPANHLAAAGYADTRPVAPNDTEEDRSLNRRVDFVIPRRPED